LELNSRFTRRPSSYATPHTVLQNPCRTDRNRRTWYIDRSTQAVRHRTWRNNRFAKTVAHRPCRKKSCHPEPRRWRLRIYAFRRGSTALPESDPKWI